MVRCGTSQWHCCALNRVSTEFRLDRKRVRFFMGSPFGATRPTAHWSNIVNLQFGLLAKSTAHCMDHELAVAGCSMTKPFPKRFCCSANSQEYTNRSCAFLSRSWCSSFVQCFRFHILSVVNPGPVPGAMSGSMSYDTYGSSIDST